MKEPDLLLKLFIGLVIAFLIMAALYGLTDSALFGGLFMLFVGASMIVFGRRCLLIGEIKPGYSYLHFSKKGEPIRFWITIGFFIGGGLFVLFWSLWFMIFM